MRHKSVCVLLLVFFYFLWTLLVIYSYTFINIQKTMKT